MQDSIRGFAARFKSAHPELDVLSMNHGVLLERTLSPDGVEMTWQVNY